MFLQKFFNCLAIPQRCKKLIPVKVCQKKWSFDIEILPNELLRRIPNDWKTLISTVISALFSAPVHQILLQYTLNIVSEIYLVSQNAHKFWRTPIFRQILLFIWNRCPALACEGILAGHCQAGRHLLEGPRLSCSKNRSYFHWAKGHQKSSLPQDSQTTQE